MWLQRVLFVIAFVMLGIAITASARAAASEQRSTLTASTAPQNPDHLVRRSEFTLRATSGLRALQQNLRLIRPFEIEQAHCCDDRENKFRMWHEGGRLHRRNATRSMPAQVPAGTPS